jgi:hypothetical protein
MEMEEMQLRECCVVPFRVTSSGTEFCLLTPISENRWEFPKVRLEETGECDAAALSEAAKGAGLRGHVTSDEPLGSYVASRGNETRSMQGYLMRVDRVDDPWPQQESHRRLWCLAEEARVRIRRKPLRRFIDLALRSVGEGASPFPSDSRLRRKAR